MKTFILPISVTLTLILFQACAAPPIQVKLKKNLGAEAVNKILTNKPCPKAYRLALDTKSSKYEIKTRPVNCCYPGLTLDWIFPIGKTLSAYLAQAQEGQGGETIPLQLDMSDFRFVMDGSSRETTYVDSVKYQANFTGPDPIGFLSIPESTYGSAPMKGGNQRMYDAVSEALRSTTVKLFDEVSARMCEN